MAASQVQVRRVMSGAGLEGTSCACSEARVRCLCAAALRASQRSQWSVTIREPPNVRQRTDKPQPALQACSPMTPPASVPDSLPGTTARVTQGLPVTWGPDGSWSWQGPPATPVPPADGLLRRTGRVTVAAAQQGLDLLAFIGEVAAVAAGTLRNPVRMRWRAVASEIEIGGFDALAIIGLTSFLLGVVVAYQGADQLQHYGANVFVVELVGYAMLREFAPLIGAIIIAGRSGSAYAAQIGTMVVNEEVDAMRTIAIDPLERLVLPKAIALGVALPLLTVFADITGVFGGMVMARTQLDIGFTEFADRFGRVMQGSALLLGIGKSLVFAGIIVVVGCFQGFRTAGSADSVGRQTTLAVVQSIFLVIVADAVFSVLFNLLDL
jgi:phospholipid/cholesterol/gamma-HCH transport system permease protein